MSPEILADRAAISDVVIAYASAVDSRDWALFRSLFTDRVYFDFRSFSPDLHGDIPVEDLVARTRTIANFDSTQHISSNHRHVIEGDAATCVSYMQASHFLKRDGVDHHCILYGYYTNSLVRFRKGWRINRYTLTVTGQTGDPRVFDWAGF